MSTLIVNICINSGSVKHDEVYSCKYKTCFYFECFVSFGWKYFGPNLAETSSSSPGRFWDSGLDSNGKLRSRDSTGTATRNWRTLLNISTAAAAPVCAEEDTLLLIFLKSVWHVSQLLI